jgi:Uri superfamily endonuclease
MFAERRLAFIPASGGTYALVMRCSFRRRVRIGALGTVATEPGYYVYVGSAFGPGGLRARIARHVGVKKKKRWHIDYLRPFLRLEEVWYSLAPRSLEHAWADRLLDIAYATSSAVVPLAKFGASDCGCETHLVRLPFRPRPDNVRPRGTWRHGIVSISWAR